MDGFGNGGKKCSGCAKGMGSVFCGKGGVFYWKKGAFYWKKKEKTKKMAESSF